MANKIRIKKEKAVVRKVKPCIMCGIMIVDQKRKKYCGACSSVALNILLAERRIRARQNMV